MSKAPDKDTQQPAESAAAPEAPEAEAAERPAMLAVLESGATVGVPNKVGTHHFDPELGATVPVRTYIDLTEV